MWILNALTEGMGVPALCRLFHVGKNSIYGGQAKFRSLKETWWWYALAYRRQTNPYAKLIDRLQQRLDVPWVVHNFVRVHFTTKPVPAVSLGIFKQPLTFTDLLTIRCVSN